MKCRLCLGLALRFFVRQASKCTAPREALFLLCTAPHTQHTSTRGWIGVDRRNPDQGGQESLTSLSEPRTVADHQRLHTPHHGSIPRIKHRSQTHLLTPGPGSALDPSSDFPPSLPFGKWHCISSDLAGPGAAAITPATVSAQLPPGRPQPWIGICSGAPSVVVWSMPPLLQGSPWAGSLGSQGGALVSSRAHFDCSSGTAVLLTIVLEVYSLGISLGHSPSKSTRRFRGRSEWLGA
mmetsp:Transcript_19711/g.35075  ORF Transcript_19711/g.35075 Transcript_19711/m.35075 type:complete len:237 (-) Transcript_19711:474-1184(-)